WQTWAMPTPWAKSASAWRSLTMTCSGVCRVRMRRLLCPQGASETLIAHGPGFGEHTSWDKDFSVFLAWCLVADHDEHQLVHKIDVNVVEQTPETLGKNRFMVIEPRESVSSKIILTMPFRAFSYDVATLYLEGRRVNHYRGVERFEHFEIPRQSRSL